MNYEILPMLRTALNLSTEDVAELLNCSRPTINKIEKGETKISLPQQLALYALFSDRLAVLGMSDRMRKAANDLFDDTFSFEPHNMLGYYHLLYRDVLTEWRGWGCY